jgi:hypothetical protein
MRSGLLLLIVTGMMAGSAHCANANWVNGVPATYELLICKSACSFSDPGSDYQRATVVLLGHTMTRKDVESIDVSYFDYGHDPAKGCYRIAYFSKGQSDPLRETRTGAMPWRLRGDTLELTLLHSVDAFYIVSLKQIRGRLEGRGAYFSGPTDSPVPDDLIVGRRVGAPDISACKR